MLSVARFLKFSTNQLLKPTIGLIALFNPTASLTLPLIEPLNRMAEGFMTFNLNSQIPETTYELIIIIIGISI